VSFRILTREGKKIEEGRRKTRETTYFIFFSPYLPLAVNF
jgi:hypothetical protein